MWLKKLIIFDVQRVTSPLEKLAKGSAKSSESAHESSQSGNDSL